MSLKSPIHEKGMSVGLTAQGIVMVEGDNIYKQFSLELSQGGD